MVSPININNNPTMQGSPNMQGVPPNLALAQERLKEDVNNNIVIKKFESTEKPGLLFGLMLPIWLGIGQLMEKFNKKCAGEYKNSIPGKIGTWADKIGSNRFFQSPSVQSFEKWLQNSKAWTTKNIINKSKILSAFANTPSKAEFSMVKTMQKGTLAELANDAKQIIDEHIKKPQTLQELGVSQKWIDKIKNFPADKQAELTKRLKLKQIGLNNKTYGKISKDATEAVDDIIKAFSKVDKTKSVGIWRKTPGLGKILGRDVYFSEVVNKLQALKGSKNPHQVTTLGKMLPKGLLRTMEGLTNGTAGGKFMILMQAYIFADALIQSAQAPKGEKWKSFTERISQDLGFYLTMPLALQTMHRFGGLQYIGMNKAQVASYRDALKTFNETAKTGGFANKTVYKNARDGLKSLLKGNSKWYHKPFKKFGRILTVGLEQIRPYKSATAMGKAGNVFKNAKYWFKQGAGWPMRFLAFGMVFGPFFSNLCVKASHAIFGRPTQSVLDKAPATAAEPTPANASTPNAITTPSATTTPDTTNVQTAKNIPAPSANNPGSSLLNNYNPSNPFSQAVQNKPAKNDDDYTYIPSSTGIVLDGNTAPNTLANALAKADYAEQQALKHLK